MAILNSQELKSIQDISKELKDVNKNLKDFTNTFKQLNNRTNKNTLMHRLVEAVESVATELKEANKKSD